MADIVSIRRRSEIMALVLGKDNKSTEQRLMRVFRECSIVGWRRGSKLPGRPDFFFPLKGMAIFVDGCFWHGCKIHGTKPKTNTRYWLKKIATNKNRDRRVNDLLRRRGIRVLRIWEHELGAGKRVKLKKRLARWFSDLSAGFSK